MRFAAGCMRTTKCHMWYFGMSFAPHSQSHVPDMSSTRQQSPLSVLSMMFWLCGMRCDATPGPSPSLTHRCQSLPVRAQWHNELTHDMDNSLPDMTWLTLDGRSKASSTYIVRTNLQAEFRHLRRQQVRQLQCRLLPGSATPGQHVSVNVSIGFQNDYNSIAKACNRCCTALAGCRNPTWLMNRNG